jgi:YebC/PmpR family DNA-binding regulatory protein
MAGHSKWHQIRHRKVLTDAKKARVFSNLSAMITIAAKEKGGDPNANPKLRMAIEKARAMNLPQENIVRAIKRGTGELAGAAIEEALYEGYGPDGVAILVEALTDNKNRTLGELRQIFSERQGKLGGSGSAQWMFERVLKESAIEYIAKSPIEIQDPDTIKKLQALFEALDEHPDVKEIYSNARF